MAYGLAMDLAVQVVSMVVWLAASPVGAWYTNRHPSVRNDSWGGALGLLLSWLGFLLAVAFCAWRSHRLRNTLAAEVNRG